jgi:hypothetical protein
MLKTLWQDQLNRSLGEGKVLSKDIRGAKLAGKLLCMKTHLCNQPVEILLVPPVAEPT